MYRFPFQFQNLRNDWFSPPPVDHAINAHHRLFPASLLYHSLTAPPHSSSLYSVLVQFYILHCISCIPDFSILTVAKIPYIGPTDVTPHSSAHHVFRATAAASFWDSPASRRVRITTNWNTIFTTMTLTFNLQAKSQTLPPNLVPFLSMPPLYVFYFHYSYCSIYLWPPISPILLMTLPTERGSLASSNSATSTAGLWTWVSSEEPMLAQFSDN